ncbi:MAG: tripartite tricarboxylate transporter substrate binding protein [Betaproteobacteria bacterium]|nr:tripartite tricarboxylate transporter substrate binding protein [Betaproteobacteria bacterium]MBI3053574.1 tripartite tricarboxylate transporter substrate binding protein [Betaproteobacteria bacterium]
MLRLIVSLGLLAFVMAGNVFGQAYPTRPIRLIVPFPPGGNVDVFSRVLFRQVELELGQNIVIDNRGGANGLIGADVVANAVPDGYTLLNTSFAFAVNPSILKKMPFDIKKDFAPITNVALGLGYLMVINNDVPAKTVPELIALAKKRPISYSTAGIGNGQHLAGALFTLKAGIDMLHVPYKGGGPAMTALLGGEVQVHFPAGSVGVPLVKQGRARALGFTGAKRLSSLPDVPTVGESVPGYVADAGWHGMFAPAKTPAAIVKKVQLAVRKALQEPKVRSHFVDNGYEPQGDPPDVWAKKFRADVDLFADIVRKAKIERQ